MVEADGKNLAYRVYEAANAKDVTAMKELFAPHVVNHSSGIGGENGEEAMNKVYAAYPDMRFVVEDVLAEGDKVALRVTIHGIPQQPLPIIMEIFRIEDGKIAEIWSAGTLRWPPAS